MVINHLLSGLILQVSLQLQLDAVCARCMALTAELSASLSSSSHGLCLVSFTVQKCLLVVIPKKDIFFGNIKKSLGCDVLPPEAKLLKFMSFIGDSSSRLDNLSDDFLRHQTKFSAPFF